LKLRSAFFGFDLFTASVFGVCELARIVYTYDEFIDMVWTMAANPRFDVLRAGLHGAGCFRFSAGSRN
jgi:hypothetical protein